MTMPPAEGTPEPVTLTEHEAFAVMSEFLWQYARRAGDDLFTLLGDIGPQADGQPTDPAAWDDWVDCIAYVKARKPPRTTAD